MSLLQHLFQLRGDAPAKPKTLGDLITALRSPEPGEPAPAEPAPAIANPQSPCLDDPALPALTLQPTVESAHDAPVILGTPPQPAAPPEQPAFIHVTPRPPRIAPLIAGPPILPPGKCELRLRIIAEFTLDADALIRHVTAFPGVTDCRISSDDAHD